MSMEAEEATIPTDAELVPDHLGKMVMVIRDGAIIPVQTKEKA